MKNYFLTIIILFYSCCSFAQVYTLSGKVVDNKNQEVPFATVFVKGTTKGTAANSNGEYSLKLPAGKQIIAFTSVGFKLSSQTVDINNSLTLDVVLQPELYALKDVNVYANAEDPAYQIIRNAIKQRKNYLKETAPYTAQIYIKGVTKLLKAPQKFLGKDLNEPLKEAGLDSNRTGILYQSESQAILSFTPPNNYHEEMISSKVAGSNKGFSFNRASSFNISFYENYLNWDGLSNRPFVSPIAENALFYYDYKLIGSFLENGELINKIQLLPKRKYDPAYRGYIYIVEDSWRLHSVDFLMSKESNIMVFDSLQINQQFIAIDRKHWKPSVMKYNFTGGLLGFKFGGYSVGIFSNYNLKPDLAAINFKEQLKISKGINKKDSIFWAEERPIPLTLEEVSNYTKKDSIALLRTSKPYLDSLDKLSNKFKFSKLLMSGYAPRDRFKKEYYQINSIAKSFLFNTVEGFAINYGASFTKQIDSVNNRYFNWKGNIRYGFSNKLFHANTQAFIPLGKSLRLSLGMGSDMVDLNNKSSLTILENEFNSLFYQKNYKKFYQKKYTELTLSSKIAAGLNGSFGIVFNDNIWKPNASNYSFYTKNDSYTSNNPFTPTVDEAVFPRYQSLKIGIALNYNFSNKYETYPNGKRYLPSDWPTVNFTYIKAIPKVFSSDVDYEVMSFGIRKEDLKLGFYGNIGFSIAAGKFFNVKNIYYPDFKQFNGNKTMFYTSTENQFLFLDYYLQSTSDKYFEAHAQHNFSGFFTNKVPLLRKLKLKEIVGANYLSTPSYKNYSELYFGLSYLVFNAYYGFGYQDAKQISAAFRVSVQTKF